MVTDSEFYIIKYHIYSNREMRHNQCKIWYRIMGLEETFDILYHVGGGK